MSRRARIFILAAFLPILLAASIPHSDLTVEKIMRGPGLVGYPPREVRWSGDGQRIYFGWKQASDPVLAEFDTYVVNRDGSGLRKLNDEEARLTPPARGELTRDRARSVFVRSSDLYLYDYATDSARRLTRTRDVESSPHFLRDGRRVSFVRANNLYVVSLDDGMIERVTNLRTGPPAGAAGQRNAADDDEDKKGTESQEWLKKEEKDLLDIVKQRAAQKDADEARRKADHWLKPHSLKSTQSVREMQFTPDEKYIVAVIVERAGEAQRAVVPNYVSQNGYAETIPSRTKVGDLQDKAQLAIINTATGELKLVNHGLVQPQPVRQAATGNTSSPSNEQSAQAQSGSQESKQTDSATKSDTKTADRDVACSLPLWSEDGARAVMVARSADNKDEWVMALDPATAKARLITALHDDAWIAGPGVFRGNGDPGEAFTLGWMKDDQTVFFQSERTGYSQLYVVPFAGGEPKALTSGNFEVLRAWLSQDKSQFYLETNEGDAGQHNLFAMPATGGARTRITNATGMHDVRLSRDEKFVADVFSYINRPPELYVQENQAGAEARKLTTSPTREFAERNWLVPEVVAILARDGTKVPAHLFKPLVRGKKPGPAVIFVHGAGYLQNVHSGWSSYQNEYMFHNLLVERGYTVLQLDYRGSAGYGRDWRTAIYRHMGGTDLDDQVDAAHWLAQTQNVDPKRIGIYGGSYGGFITLMAMFTQPDVFAAGAALRPVTDWAHYNHPYTSDILNLPQKDADAYRKSSPIYFANGLKGALLICHGMADTNVHFQDTVRLAQKLIELHKENWELAVYPVENHGFVQPASWTDEYSRILKLFDDNLMR